MPKFQYTVDDSFILGDDDDDPNTPDVPIKSLGNNNGVLDIGDLGSQPLRLFYQDQVTDITQVRLDGGFNFEDGNVQVRRRNARDGNASARLGGVLPAR